ncbi:hypothetical protein CIB48_g9011 [Xylaria polymorpha]|nr:hypothetical protein CIB48_g9011 [Xylaria polymorpha]
MTTTAPATRLTTIFTPSPECTTPHLYFCGESGCSASVGIDRNRQPCFPSNTANNYGLEEGAVLEFPAGLLCPHGMTVASNLPSQNAVYCCYRPSSSDGYIGPDRCLGTLTEGTFVMVEKTESDVSWTFAFGPGLTHRFNSVASKSEFGGMIYTGPPTILATGPAIFLAAHNLPSPSTGSDFSYSEETGPVSSGETGPVSSRGNELVPPEPSKTPNDPRMPEVGIIIVYRKRLRREMPAHIEAAEEKQERQEEDMGKPEMEDNTVDPLRLVKVELDALVIRAELEGSEVPDARRHQCDEAGASRVARCARFGRRIRQEKSRVGSSGRRLRDCETRNAVTQPSTSPAD